MKKAISVFMSCLMLLCFSVPAFAAEQEERYVPLIPEFLDASGGGVNVNVPIDKEREDIQAFFSGFYDGPYLIVLDQWTATSYYPQYGNTSTEQEWIGDDRKWSISFIKPHVQSTSKHFAFTYHDPLTYRYTEPNPMQVGIDGGSFGMTVLSYHYDFKTKQLGYGALRSNVSQMHFSYVIGSAALSESSTTYPYYSKLAGERFTVSSYVQGGIACHYNWWIGRKDIDNTVRPPKPVDPPPEPPKPPEPPEPPIPPERPTFPDWEDMQPETPFNPFDPYDPPSNPNDNWKPPVTDGVYDPTDDIILPTMPDIPFVPPTIPDSGEDPFTPPTVPGSGDDPFTPPTVPGSGNDPFKPPTIPGSGNDPFAPPTVPGSGNDPFAPPTVPGSGNDPFKPPTVPGSGEDPFSPPDISSGDYDPFKPPVVPPSTEDPFKPPSAPFVREAAPTPAPRSSGIADYFRSLISHLFH